MIFIDTGPFIAKYFVHDQFHKKSLSIWGKLEKSEEALITSNFVLDEVFTLLARKSYYEFASEKANIIYNSNVIEILRPTHDVELAALRYFKKFSDQQVSFTDCISFQLMKDHRLDKVFTFDKHFQLAGFKVIS